MEDLLIKVGLTDLQARVYLYLLENGSTTPPQLVDKLKITRSNTYKVLDALDGFGLVSKAEVEKKLTYFPEDPIALSNLAAEERNRLIALEEHTKDAVTDLRRKFRNSSGQAVIKTKKGVAAVKAAYEEQAKLGLPLYFIKSRADIPTMGFDSMDHIRRLAKHLGLRRYGITPDSVEGPINPSIDKATNLTRTWMPEEEYTAPVEWSLAGDELNIIIFDKEPAAIKITNQQVAESFLQVWKLLDKNLRANPDYKNLPRKAKRKL